MKMDLRFCKEREQGPIPWQFYLWKQPVLRFIWQLLSISASTALVYGWQPFSSMLFATGVYESLCYPHEAQPRINAEGEPQPVCSAQDSRIQSLYSINMASEFVVGTLAGVSLDRFGPLVTGVIGQLTLLVAAVCLVLASTFESLYLISTALFGASANFIVFPAIASADYFPSKKGLAASIAVACQQGSSGISTVLNLLFQLEKFSLQVEFAGYLLFVLLPLAGMYCLATPLIRPALDPRYNHHEGREKDDGFDGSTAGQSRVEIENSHRSSNQCTIATPPTPTPLRTPMAVPTDSPIHQKPTMKPRSLKEDLTTVEYVFMGIFVVLIVLLFNYYPIVVRELSGDAIARFNGYFMPTQAIWGILFGCVVDRTGTLPLCYVLVFLAGFVYLFCLIDSFPLQYLTTILFVLGSSFCFTVKFTYIQEIFHPRHHGVLLAILSLLSGATMLINILLRNVAYPRLVIHGMLGAAVVAGVIVGILHWRFAHGIRYFVPGDTSSHDAVATPRQEDR